MQFVRKSQIYITRKQTYINQKENKYRKDLEMKMLRKKYILTQAYKKFPQVCLFWQVSLVGVFIRAGEGTQTCTPLTLARHDGARGVKGRGTRLKIGQCVGGSEEGRGPEAVMCRQEEGSAGYQRRKLKEMSFEGVGRIRVQRWRGRV